MISWLVQLCIFMLGLKALQGVTVSNMQGKDVCLRQQQQGHWAAHKFHARGSPDSAIN